MRIQPGDMIAGYPALVMRKLMQRGRGFGPTTSGNPLATIAEVLSVDFPTARQVFQKLCEEEYIEPAHLHSSKAGEDENWYTTTKGNALSNATARKPITRQTADRLIEQLLNRIQQINAGNYAYKIKRVILFGSYLGDSPTLGDIDLSIVLEDRYQDAPSRKAGHDVRLAIAMAGGRHFRDFMAMLMWPRQEVLLLLRNHSPSLSLHDEGRERVLERQIPSKILFDADFPTYFDNRSFEEQKCT